MAERRRVEAYKESSLPYSFMYKIPRAFYGKECPICGAKMQRAYEDGVATSNRIPTIQHNTPISKGGKHELGNISVICKQCNISIKNQPTENLNEREVTEVWQKISGTTG